MDAVIGVSKRYENALNNLLLINRDDNEFLVENVHFRSPFSHTLMSILRTKALVNIYSLSVTVIHVRSIALCSQFLEEERAENMNTLCKLRLLLAKVM